jgi:S-adenosylmethionine synthetase
LTVHADLCLGPFDDGEEEFRRVSDDQSIVTGYAVDLPGANYLPAEHWLAWRLARHLHALRTERPELRLGPDGKVLVVLAEDGEQLRLEAVSASMQQAVDGPEVALHQAVRAAVAAEVRDSVWRLGGFSPQAPGEIHVNGAGNFAVGGPEGDNGLAGKKLVADAYGPRVPIGGGALSGKDFFKADRAGALMARRLARAVVQTGVARACTCTLAFFPGQEAGRLLSLRDEQGRALDGQRWSGLFDLGLAGCGERWTGRADLVDVARWGHFTADRPWETLHFDRSCREDGA